MYASRPTGAAAARVLAGTKQLYGGVHDTFFARILPPLPPLCTHHEASEQVVDVSVFDSGLVYFQLGKGQHLAGPFLFDGQARLVSHEGVIEEALWAYGRQKINNRRVLRTGGEGVSRDRLACCETGTGAERLRPCGRETLAKMILPWLSAILTKVQQLLLLIRTFSSGLVYSNHLAMITASLWKTLTSQIRYTCT